MTYLSNFQILASQDLEQVRHLLNNLNDIRQLDIIGETSQFNARINAIDMEDISFCDVSYGDTTVKINCPGEHSDKIFLGITNSGHVSANHQNQEFYMTQKYGYVRDMGIPIIASQNKFRTLGMSITKSSLLRHIRVLTGEDVVQNDIIFQTHFDLTTTAGKCISELLKYSANALNNNLLDIDNTIIQKTLRDALLSNMLVCIPHTLSSYFDTNKNNKILPSYLKRACEYIHEHADQSITLQSLATYSNCSYRTLQTGFKITFGISPMAYLKSVRLQKVYDELITEDTNTNISSVALKWGFLHMGNFAQDFKKKFGKLPSEVVRFNI